MRFNKSDFVYLFSGFQARPLKLIRLSANEFICFAICFAIYFVGFLLLFVLKESMMVMTIEIEIITMFLKLQTVVEVGSTHPLYMNIV